MANQIEVVLSGVIVEYQTTYMVIQVSKCPSTIIKITQKEEVKSLYKCTYSIDVRRQSHFIYYTSSWHQTQSLLRDFMKTEALYLVFLPVYCLIELKLEHIVTFLAKNQLQN